VTAAYKAFFDTSVLVAAFLGDHDHHGPCLDVLSKMTPDTGACAAHSLSEFYSVTTRMPLRPKILPEQSILFLEDVERRLKPIALTAKQYRECIQDAAKQHIIGGQTYDAVILACARTCNTERIYTLNQKHFVRIAPDLRDRIRRP